MCLLVIAALWPIQNNYDVGLVELNMQSHDSIVNFVDSHLPRLTIVSREAKKKRSNATTE